MEDFIEDPEKFRLTNVPGTVYYIPNFISQADEEAIISQVYASPRPKWNQLIKRRLQNWGGIPHPKGMVAEVIPQWLHLYIEQIDKLGLMSGHIPNHVLVNEYLSGQGIMPHLDGSLFYPTINTISCGSNAILNFVQHVPEGGENNTPKSYSILLERRSLLVIQNEMYHKYLHSIDNATTDIITESLSNFERCSQKFTPGQNLDRETRISLTIRHVPKTTKMKISI